MSSKTKKWKKLKEESRTPIELQNLEVSNIHPVGGEDSKIGVVETSFFGESKPNELKIPTIDLSDNSSLD